MIYLPVPVFPWQGYSDCDGGCLQGP
jgi:hypothetical protein